MSRPERPDTLAYARLYEEATLRGWVPNDPNDPNEALSPSIKPAAIWAREVPNVLPPGHLPVRPLGWYDPLGNFHRQTDHLCALGEALEAWTTEDARALGLVLNHEGDWRTAPNETWPNGRLIASWGEPEQLRDRLYTWLKGLPEWAKGPPASHRQPAARCGSRKDGAQCDRLDGHSGDHHSVVMGTKWATGTSWWAAPKMEADPRLPDPALTSSMPPALTSFMSEEKTAKAVACAEQIARRAVALFAKGEDEIAALLRDAATSMGELLVEVGSRRMEVTSLRALAKEDKQLLDRLRVYLEEHDLDAAVTLFGGER